MHLATGAYEVLTTVRGDDVVQAVASRYEQHQERERILGALAVAGGIGLVLSTLAGALMARRAVQPMATALDLQRRFVADAGHELRTPLTLLSTRAQLLARHVSSADLPAGALSERIAGDVDGIVTDTAALTAILEELLIAADVREPVPTEPVDITDLVDSVIASAAATAESRGIALSADTAAGSTTVAAGAPVALSRCITALVDNALGHARRQVVVTVERHHGSVVVKVTDDGPGISADALPRMFSRFASDRSAGGTTQRVHYGLGLALVSEIATRHGGTVAAANRKPPATGAILRLSIPA
jgi:signal transduction histidine kinase